MMLVPESLPESQSSLQLEPTQLSQPYYSQTQQASQLGSQVETRQKFWAIFIPENPAHSILKLPWSRPSLQIGRSPIREMGNNLVLPEKRISNRHCRITLGFKRACRGEEAGTSAQSYSSGPDSDAEPQVWVEDLNSSNGTFVNGAKLNPRTMLQDGDELSLGHVGAADNHDVRYIFRSVGARGSAPNGGQKVGQVYERYQMLSSLGKGTFAEVKKAVDVETGDMRAIKQIVKHRFQHDPKTLNLFQREIEICKTLTHENICRLIEWYEDPQHICLVLEYIDGGDLLDTIMKWDGPGMPEDVAADLTWQICRAVGYCHEMGVTHRDLKPENILLTTETPDTPRQIKIADFGLSKMVHTGTMLTSMVGTPQYLAPEVVMQTRQKPGYENVVDCWSVGIIVYSMMTKALPFDEQETDTLEQRIRRRFTQPFDVATLEAMNISSNAIHFISRLLEKDPSQRMTMAEALQHPWLSLPSSQDETPPQPTLGGDSMWNIQAFEYDEDYPIEDGDPDSAVTDEGRWSRPMTASATNLGAGSEVPTGSDDFSQPLQNLRLISRVGGSRPPSFLGDGSLPTPSADEDRLFFPAPPPRDGLQPDPIDRAATATPVGRRANGASKAVNGATKAVGAMGLDEAEGATRTPVLVKRKLGETGDSASKLFSSGSLSPPPPENGGSGMDMDKRDGGRDDADNGGEAEPEVRIELDKASISVHPTKATRRSTRSTAHAAPAEDGAQTPPPSKRAANGKSIAGSNGSAQREGTRSSPRRPRKSTRLA